MSRTKIPQKSLFGLDASRATLDRTQRDRRSELGQFFTPDAIADFMASLFEAGSREIRLLDAGAGRGSLSAAFVRHSCRLSAKPVSIAVTAFEIDPQAVPGLHATMSQCHRECTESGIEFTFDIRHEDFIAAAAASERGLFADKVQFDVAIANPPYRKISSLSPARRMLSAVGIEASNLYSGFISLIMRLLAPGGQLVAITPRSFCNGPYFKPFRTDLLKRMSLRRVHVFDSRSTAFAGDDVLQENVIFHAVKGRKPPSHVVISSSEGAPGSLVAARGMPYAHVVSPDDPEQFIHLETDDVHRVARGRMSTLTAKLNDLGLKVSTGRVVDFRSREFLRTAPEPDTVPLIYPCHFHMGTVVWPKTGGRKPNAIKHLSATRDLLVPRGYYVLVKRFSAKEERRRIVACLCDPERLPGDVFGIENHLNYFHADGHGMDRDLALGLTAFLNATIVDHFFRQFSGHTQVNSTDLRSLHYPAIERLQRFGRQHGTGLPAQAELDELVERELF